MSPSGSQVRYQRVVASTSASTPVMSSSWASRVAPSRRSTTSQRASAPVTSRAIRNARTTSAGSAPRSATSCDMKVGPSALTTALELTMQISCLRSGCWPR